MFPFVVFALPRSRTYWLSRFLSDGAYTCGHDEIMHFRTLEDVKSWFVQPCIGSVETGAAPWWRLLAKYAPGCRVATVRRPIRECVESTLGADPVLYQIVGRSGLTAEYERLSRKLDQIEGRIKNVVTVDFKSLSNEDACKRLYEHCTGYAHNHDRWLLMARDNKQVSLPSMTKYCIAYQTQMRRVAAMAKHETVKMLMARRVAPPDGFTIQEEVFDSFWRDGAELFAEHCKRVGEAPGSYLAKNEPLMRAVDSMGNMSIITARSNGKMFGYLMTVLSPSFEDASRKSAIQTTFFVSENAPNMGIKMQRAAIEKLRERGVEEVFFRAGPRGDGPRMGAMFKRIGASHDGEFYRMDLRH